MRNNRLLRTPYALHREQIAAAFNIENLRRSVRNGVNRALAAAAGFLRGLITETDQTTEGNETSGTRPRLPYPRMPLGRVELRMNARSMAAHKRRTAERRARLFGFKNPYVDREDNNVTPYPKARDIRPPLPQDRLISPLFQLRSPGIKKQTRRRPESGKVQQMTTHPRNPKLVDGLDEYIQSRSNYLPGGNPKLVEDLDEYIRSRRIYLPSGNHSASSETQELGSDHGNVRNSIPIQAHGSQEENRRITQKSVKQRLTGSRKYDRERSMLRTTTCRKRKHEATSKSSMEEPENKRHRIAEYWLVQKPDADDGHEEGENRDVELKLDWCQYELERRTSPQVIAKRKRKMTSEILQGEPESKRHRITEYWQVKKPAADNGDEEGENRGVQLELDWSQYELERSTSLQVCRKRRRKRTLESLLEEPEHKLRKIGD